MNTLFCVLFAVLAVALAERVLTPFGYRDSECVIEAPHNSFVTAEGNQVVIKTAATADIPSTTYYYTAPAHCGNDMQTIRNRKRLAREDPAPEETNGWLDYVGYYPPSGENNLSSFTSTYIVPGDPQNNQGSQTLFYFIGMQDNDDPNAVNILQPVLTWGNGDNAWYIKSWICCPSNITVSSPAITGLSAGSSFNGVITRESGSNWLVDSIFNGQHTALNTDVGDYIYNWADITLEVYGVNNCPDFAKGKAYFNSLKLVDSQGQSVNPAWQNDSGNTLCGGEIVQASSNSFYIQHSY